MFSLAENDADLHARAVQAVLAGDGLPVVSIRVSGGAGAGVLATNQKAAPIWLP